MNKHRLKTERVYVFGCGWVGMNEQKRNRGKKENLINELLIVLKHW